MAGVARLTIYHSPGDFAALYWFEQALRLCSASGFSIVRKKGWFGTWVKLQLSW